MTLWTFTIDALNAYNVATTLYFSNAAYIDGSANYHAIRLLQPSLINVAPNDGGVLSIFGQASVGEVELANIDGALDYLADYALDGRPATLAMVDGVTTTTIFEGTIGRMQGRGSSLFFALKTLTESLSVTHPGGSTYAGTNSLPAGLEGTADDIEGKVKPRVYGDCRNISAIPVNTSKLIYQVSSKSDCLITAVYDDGVRLKNYLVNGAHTTGNTSIAIDTGTGAIPIGALVMFDGHRTVYTVSAALSGGVVALSSGLTANVGDNAAVEVVNFFTDTTALEGATLPSVWGSYQGYFRLTASPAGVITCDAISVTANVLHRAGGVLSELATEAGITVDSSSITALDTAGVVRIYVDSDVSTIELFNRIAKSVIGYYWFDAGEMYFNLLEAPALTPDLIVEDWMIIEISRDATGIGGNGVPVNGVKMRYDRIETTQTTVAGSVSAAQRERLKNQYRETEVIDSSAKARYLLSEKVEIESYLGSKSDAVTAITRLKNIGAVRRDVIDILCDRNKPPAFSIGNTALIKKSRFGYDAGRKMVIVGFELDAKKNTIRLRLFG